MTDYPTNLPELNDNDAELLSAYIDDQLSDDERSALEARLKNDAFLRSELKAMQQTVAFITQLPTLQAPRNVTIKASDLVSSDAPDVNVLPRGRRIIRWQVFSAAAAALVVFVVGIALIAPMLMNGTGGNGDVQSVAFDTTAEAQQQAQRRADQTATTRSINQTQAVESIQSQRTDATSAFDGIVGGGAVVEQTATALNQMFIMPTATPESSILSNTAVEPIATADENQARAGIFAMETEMGGDMEFDAAADVAQESSRALVSTITPEQAAPVMADETGFNPTAIAEESQLNSDADAMMRMPTATPTATAPVMATSTAQPTTATSVEEEAVNLAAVDESGEEAADGNDDMASDPLPSPERELAEDAVTSVAQAPPSAPLESVTTPLNDITPQTLVASFVALLSLLLGLLP